MIWLTTFGWVGALLSSWASSMLFFPFGHNFGCVQPLCHEWCNTCPLVLVVLFLFLFPLLEVLLGRSLLFQMFFYCIDFADWTGFAVKNHFQLLRCCHSQFAWLDGVVKMVFTHSYLVLEGGSCCCFSLLELSPKGFFFLYSFSVIIIWLVIFLNDFVKLSNCTRFFLCDMGISLAYLKPLIAPIITTSFGIFGICALIWMNLLKY